MLNLIIASTVFRFLLLVCPVAWLCQGRSYSAHFVGTLGAYLLGATFCMAMVGRL